MTALRANVVQFWRRLSRPDLIALLLALAGGLAAVVEAEGRISSFVQYLAILSAIYLCFRLISWSRSRLLWSLRNRLIVAYLFIAVVPILLVLSLAIRSAQTLYSQLGAYLLLEDINRRVDMMADISEHIAAAHATLPRGVTEEQSERILAAQSHSVHDQELPGLSIEFTNDASLLQKIADPSKKSFAGLLQEGETLSIVSLRAIEGPKGPRIVRLRVPVTPEFLATIAPDLGAIQFNLMQRFTGGNRRGVLYL